MKLVENRKEEAKFSFGGVGEAKFRFNLLGNVAFVWIWIVFN
jgi:hypothetical protein